MRSIFLIITLFSVALLLMLSASCTTQGPAFPIGSIENPLILDDYSDSAITYEGTIRGEKLYIKVRECPKVT